MKYLVKTLKYLGCVTISMVTVMLFVLILDGRKGFLSPHGIADIPLYLSLGWMVYQVVVNKILKQDLYYYWMIAKVTIQFGCIFFTSMFAMLLFFK